MIGLIMLGSVINYLTRSTLAVAAPTVLKDLHITAQQYSWIVGAFQGAILAQPVCGYVQHVAADRVGLPGRDLGTTGLRLRAGRARPQPAAQPISITSSTASEGIAPTPPPSDMARLGTRHCAKTTGMMSPPPTRRQFVASSIAATSAAGLPAAQDEKPKIIDAWGHVSLPRFLSAEEFLAILDANGAEAAIVGTAA